MSGNDHVAEPLMTVSQLMGYLQVSRATIYNHVNQLGLPAERVGRGIRFRRSKVDAWVAAQSASAEEPELVVVA